MCPTAWARIRRWIADTQSELNRELFADLVCESGGVHFAMGYPSLDRAKAATLTSPPSRLLRVPNSLLSRIVRWRLGRCRVRVDSDGAPLRLYVVSAVDHQGVAVPLRDTRLRAWAVDPCRPFHREVHTSECCMKAGPTASERVYTELRDILNDIDHV